MQFGGVLPEDAPDPSLEQAERLRAMPVPVIGLRPQASLEEAGIGVNTASDQSGFFEFGASISYLLWRNPTDKADPVNLAELDEQTLAAIEDVPPWPRPKWLIDHVERMRYPLLWEAVKTTWHRDASEHATLGAALVHHVNHVLHNQYRTQRGFEGNPWDPPTAGDITQAAVRSGVPVMIDGVQVAGAEIDTDPFVYGLGAVLSSGGMLTAVLPRDELEHIRLEFSRRQ